MSIHKLLAGALGVQVLLGIFTWMPRGDTEATVTPLLGVDEAAVTAIEILRKPAGEAEAHPVRLERRGEGWAIASAGGYPADPTRVEEVLDKLVDLEVGRPIATQATSHGTLKVAEDDYGKRVRVTAGGTTHTVYLGAAAAQSVHVRREGEPQVYLARGLSEWAVRDTDRGYYDGDYLSLEPETVLSVVITNPQGTLSLSREAGAWTSPDLPEGAALDAAKVDALVRKASRIRIAEPAGSEVQPAWGLSDGTRVVWTGSDGDQTVTTAYVIGALDGVQRTVKADDAAFAVRVSTSSVDDLLTADLAGLLATAPEAVPE